MKTRKRSPRPRSNKQYFHCLKSFRSKCHYIACVIPQLIGTVEELMQGNLSLANLESWVATHQENAPLIHTVDTHA